MYPVLVVDDLRSFEGSDSYYGEGAQIAYLRNLEDLQTLIMDYHNVHVEDLWLDYDLGGQLTGEHILAELINLQVHDEGAFTVTNIFIITQNPIGRDRLIEAAVHLSDSVRIVDPVASGLISAPMPSVEGSVGELFVNELGNHIYIDICRTDTEVTVMAVGPTSRVEHTWTIEEAKKLRDLLQDVLADDNKGEVNNMGTEYTPETDETETTEAATSASEETSEGTTSEG